MFSTFCDCTVHMHMTLDLYMMYPVHFHPGSWIPPSHLGHVLQDQLILHNCCLSQLRDQRWVVCFWDIHLVFYLYPYLIFSLISLLLIYGCFERDVKV